MLHPSGGGTPRIGKSVADDGAGAATAGALPGPVGARLWVDEPSGLIDPRPPPRSEVPSVPSEEPVPPVPSEVVVGESDAAEVSAVADTLAWARPKVIDVVAV